MPIAKIIILEGPDGSGKTTLANQLRNKLGYIIIKTGPPKPNEDVFCSYTNALLTAVESGKLTVFDRHYLGELIYGPLLRGENKLGVQGRDLLERLIAARGVTLVVCSPSWKTLVAGWRGKDDLLKQEQQLHTVCDAYLAEAERLHLRVYDWTATSGDWYEAAPMSLPAGVTGYHQADTLFIGERPGTTRPEWDLPFHSMTGSARYLWETLHGISDWQDQRGVWVNAFNVAGKQIDLTAVITSLPNLRRVVALGGVAYQACTHQHIGAVQVQHPAYWRRFHHHDVDEYQKLLRTALQRNTR